VFLQLYLNNGQFEIRIQCKIWRVGCSSLHFPYNVWKKVFDVMDDESV
jgi:hypothetical protein